MKILLIKIELRAEWVHSLKEKRMIVLSLCKRLTNKFNVSVSEVDHQDVHQSIVIGICSVGTSRDVLQALKEKILDFIEDNTDAELLKIEEDEKIMRDTLTKQEESISVLDEKYSKLKLEVNSFDEEINNANKEIHDFISNYENSKVEVEVNKNKILTHTENIKSCLLYTSAFFLLLLDLLFPAAFRCIYHTFLRLLLFLYRVKLLQFQE